MSNSMTGLSIMFNYYCALRYTSLIWNCTIYIHLFPTLGKYKVIGSFDNPAGFAACLCAGFPFFFFFLVKKELWIRCISICGIATVGYAVFLSGSRAGILALAVVCIAGFFYLFQVGAKYKIVIEASLAILLTIGLYFIKKDSANGRLLIWRCSWEMVKEKPMTGYGQGGFKANYMNYQALYFEEHPDNKLSMLADNISRPFNEYVELLVNFGIVGFFLFFLFLFFIIRAFKQKINKTIFTYIAAWCLTAIAIFAFFSYPLRYPCCLGNGIVELLDYLEKSKPSNHKGHKGFTRRAQRI